MKKIFFGFLVFASFYLHAESTENIATNVGFGNITGSFASQFCTYTSINYTAPVSSDLFIKYELMYLRKFEAVFPDNGFTSHFVHNWGGTINLGIKQNLTQQLYTMQFLGLGYMSNNISYDSEKSFSMSLSILGGLNLNKNFDLAAGTDIGLVFNKVNFNYYTYFLQFKYKF